MRIRSILARVALGTLCFSHLVAAQRSWYPFLSFGSDAAAATGTVAATSLLVQPGAFMESPRGSMLARWSSTVDPSVSQFGAADLDLRTRLARVGQFESSVLATGHYAYGVTEPGSPSDRAGTASLRLQLGSSSPSHGLQWGLGIDSWRSSAEQHVVPASSVSGWIRRFGLSFSADVSAHALPGSGRSVSSDSARIVPDTGRTIYTPQTGPDTIIGLAPVSTPVASSATPQDFTAHTFGQARLRVSGVLMDLGVEGDAGIMMATHGTTRSFGSIVLSHWLTPGMAIIGGLVLHPPDPGSSVRRGGGLLGLRFAGAPRLIPHLVNAPKAGVSSLSVRVAEANTILEVRAAGVSHLELSGDFTHWLPVALERTGGDRWVLVIKVAPGVHHLVVRVDGGDWAPPPGIPQAVDLYQGNIGVIVVG